MSAAPGEDKESIKAGLKAWWSGFTKSSSKASSSLLKERKDIHGKVFGEPLRTSLKYASVAISMAGDDGNQYVWGYVPIIVAKVGLFLKENATEVEGVFRIAGSQKRMRELQETFDTGPKYGKNVVWDKYMVHDAASVLRRYLNQMPEPIVPLDLYSEFRNVMYRRPLDVEAASRTYKLLIKSMPPANQYLLLYVLDLLAVFARMSEVNRMPASNLAVIFQPGIFSHPSHLSDANEHKLAVEVLEFLIEHQDYFVLRISQPTPTTIEGLDLTSVSSVKPELTAEQLDVAEASDSDEELGVLTMHEGGGARIARRSTTASAGDKKKPNNRFLRKKGLPADRSGRTSTEAAVGATEAEERMSQSTETSTPKPSSPKGEIIEMELGVSPTSQSLGGLRRSRTVPSRRSHDENSEKRSISGGKVKAKRNESVALPKVESSAIEEKAKATTAGKAAEEREAPVKEEISSKQTQVETLEEEPKEAISDTGLPTPPPSKLLNVDTTTESEAAAATRTTTTQQDI